MDMYIDAKEQGLSISRYDLSIAGIWRKSSFLIKVQQSYSQSFIAALI